MRLFSVSCMLQVCQLLAVLCSLLLAHVSALDVELDLEGIGGAAMPATRSFAKSVMFYNNHENQSIYLYWVNDNGADSLIGEIAPLGSSTVNTYTEHKFYAALDLAGRNVLPNSEVTVKSYKDSYSYGTISVPRTTSKNSDDLGGSPRAVAGPATAGGATPHPDVKFLNQRTTACSAKFRSHVPTKINIWYEDNKGGSFQGSLTLGKEYTVNTYEGHIFFFTDAEDKSKEYARHVMRGDQVLYMVQDPSRPPPQAMLDHQAKEEQFMREYFNRTGVHWRHYYGPDGPRPPPKLHMWPADTVGQVHSVTTNTAAARWTCSGPKSQCQEKSPVSLKLEVVSTAPRVFIIKNFLNHYEAESIIRTADPIKAGSTVGNNDGGGLRTSDTRTSRNAWVGRSASAVTETLFARAEQLLNISRLDRGNTEDMQVVHYKDGQKYDSHHDWGVTGSPESRYITLLMYLTDMVSPTAGGETSFPKGGGGRGIKVHPGKGSAVLFYNLLPDGNGDDLSLHAALPIHEGEKWLANFWVWDPKRR